MKGIVRVWGQGWAACCGKNADQADKTEPVMELRSVKNCSNRSWIETFHGTFRSRSTVHLGIRKHGGIGSWIGCGRKVLTVSCGQNQEK